MKEGAKEKCYETIVFDLGNTLIKFDHAISARKLANLFKIDQKKIYDMFFDSTLTHAFEKGLISGREFHAQASKMLNIALPYKDFVAIWNDIFWEDDAMCALARQLKYFYTLFLMTNINRLHFDYLMSKFSIMKIFDEIIPSFVVGSMKPDRAIFDDAVRRAHGKRHSMLYIDDRDDLVKEASRLGIDSIRFEGVEPLKRELRKRGVLDKRRCEDG